MDEFEFRKDPFTDQERSQKLYHVEARQNLWRIKRYLTLLLTFQIANDKGADQTTRIRRLICAFVVRNQEKSGFLVSMPI